MPSGTIDEVKTGEEVEADSAAAEAPATELPPAETPAAELSSGEATAEEAAAAPAELRRAAIEEAALDAIFRAARSYDKFRDEPVTDDTLQALYELLKWGPTSANCSPARFVFLRTRAARERLSPALSPGNREKTLAAPVTVIVAYEPKFYDRLSELYPVTADARAWFAGNEAFAAETAFRNGTLQGAYLIVAARALGLDCGPMSGFDKAKVDEEFFAYRGWKSNFLCNLGYGDSATLAPRLPRLAFDEACDLL